MPTGSKRSCRMTNVSDEATTIHRRTDVYYAEGRRAAPSLKWRTALPASSCRAAVGPLVVVIKESSGPAVTMLLAAAWLLSSASGAVAHGGHSARGSVYATAPFFQLQVVRKPPGPQNIATLSVHTPMDKQLSRYLLQPHEALVPPIGIVHRTAQLRAPRVSPVTPLRAHRGRRDAHAALIGVGHTILPARCCRVMLPH